MQEPVWIREIEVLALHRRLLAQFGGSDGIRDAGLLDSALARPKNRFAYADAETPPSVSELAAAYAYGICKNRPLVDGNKRMAMAVAMIFSEFNGVKVNATQEDAYLTFLSLAAGSISEEELTSWFIKNVAPSNNQKQ
jgi:death-on-curing protein